MWRLRPEELVRRLTQQKGKKSLDNLGYTRTTLSQKP